MRVIRRVHYQILGLGPKAEPMLHPDDRFALMVEVHTDTHTPLRAGHHFNEAVLHCDGR